MVPKKFTRSNFNFLKLLLLALTLPCTQLWAIPAAQYTFNAFNAPYTSITGTTIGGIYCDDCAQTNIPIGFTFNYVGINYTTISVCSNGFAYFSNTNQTTLTNSLSNAGPIGPMLMPLWDDLNGNCGPNYYTTTGTAPNRVFTYEMQNIQWNYYSGCNVLSFEVKLYETSNTIQFCYNQGPQNVQSGSATIGIFGGGTDYQTLPSSNANPVPSTTTFTTSINSKPASGQVYEWSTQTLTASVAGTNFCGGGNMSVSYASSGLTFTAGNTFTAELSDATGSFASPTPIGSLASTATSGTIPCTLALNQAAGTGYRVRVTSNNPAYTGTDNGTNLTINPAVTPTATISPSPNDTVCLGTNVFFNITVTNGGPTPTFQWYLNGNPTTNAANYQSSTLVTGDDIYCVITSNATCALPTTATSNHVIMEVTPLVPPTINITTSSVGDSGCLGLPIVFNSSITYGGPNPTYQWMRNGNPVVGATNPSYTDAGLADGDVITCVLTSSDPCVTPSTATSNSITMTLVPITVPTISIAASPGTLICPGSDVTFTATTTQGGPSVMYQWYKNNVPVGLNQPNYSSSQLANGDVVKCLFVSYTYCAIPDSVMSNSLTINTFTNSPYLAGITGSTVTKNLFVYYQKNTVTDANCDLMATIEPQGDNPIYGGATVKVTLDNNVNVYAGQPYLQRHFDIEPDSNAANGTAIVTLYAYQSEFDAYNAVAGPMGYGLMPTNYVYQGEIKISQFHGTGTAPGNYTGTEEIINPAVYWDGDHNWWHLTFATHGFSGFYIHTGTFPLQTGAVEHKDFSVAAFPNPVQDKVTIQVYGKQGANSSVAITDLTGRTIVTVAMNNDKAIADLSGLAAGMYLVKYSDDDRSETIKITKQ